MTQRMWCYSPGGPENEPFKYNTALNAGPIEGQTPKYSQSYQGPDYKTGGVRLGDVSVFMGTEPTSQAAEYFASNKPKNFSLKWAESVETQLKGKLLGGNADNLREEARPLKGRREKAGISFNVPQGDLPAEYHGDLKNWEFGPTTDPLDLDFSKGINGEVGMITVGNNKGGGIPDIHRTNWNDNVQVVWDEELGKYVCQLDTYMIYKKMPGIFGRKAWVIKNTGGLITTHMYASGQYEVRAKVPKAPGLVWGIWTFWGNEIWSEQQLGVKKELTDHIHHCSDSPMWVDQSTELGQILSCHGKQYPNHEIDIEIPSNAPQTKTSQESNKYDTMNMNCYRWTDCNGQGTYCNLFCHSKSGPFVGDGKYHTYRFDWHTGSADTTPRVDFYFDDAYIGTNDAFVPYMAGRLWIMLLDPNNGQLGDSGSWSGAVDPDESFHQPSCTGEVPCYARVLVDYVHITPFNEPNDHYAPSAFDQPCMGTQPGCVDCGSHNPRCGTTSILPYTTATETGCGGIKWVKRLTS